MAPLKVLIIGAGVGGSATAFWLSRLGHHCTIVERWPSLRASGLQIDLRGQGITTVSRMGLLDAIRAATVQEEGVNIIDERGKSWGIFAANKTGQGRQSFTSEFELMRSDLVQIMVDGFKDRENVRFKFGTTVERYDDWGNDKNPVRVTFSDGTEDTYDLVAAADGQYSRTRRTMLGLQPGERDPTIRPLGLFIAYFRIPHLPDDTDMAVCCAVPGGRMMMTRSAYPGITQVYLNLQDGHPLAPELQAAVERRDLKAQGDVWAAAYKGCGWQAERILKGLAAAVESKDLYTQRLEQIRSDTWRKGRVVLVGDAGYCPSPLTAFGTSAALIGAYILAGEVVRHTTKTTPSAGGEGGEVEAGVVDVPLALEAYDAKLRPFMATVQKIPPRWVRRLIMPTSAWGIQIFLWIVRLIALLRIDKLLQGFGSDDIAVKGWEFPEYPEMDVVGEKKK